MEQTADEAQEGGRTSDPLDRLRERIDAVDASIVEALSTRYRLAEEVGRLKGQGALPALDPAREAVIVRKASEAARARGIPEEGVRQLFWSMLALCREGVRGASRSDRVGAVDPVPTLGGSRPDGDGSAGGGSVADGEESVTDV